MHGHMNVKFNKMHRCCNNILISTVCYMFRARGFIFRKMAVRTGIVWIVYMQGYKQSTTYEVQDCLYHSM